MAVFSPLIQPVPKEYANWLAVPEPGRREVPPRYGLVLALVLLCLVPRVWMAGKIASLCPDGVLYVRIGQSFEQGDLQGAMKQMRLNIYPLFLVGLHRLGFDWEAAGKVWGVLVSCLLVLPLFGWLRRQFDDRVAAVACFLYAVHAEFITWSPETIRDPTFWFLFVLSLYLLWRAVTEVRLLLFLAAGLVISLAVLTRFEGFFLVIPLALWSFWRWRALDQARGRLVLGALLSFFLFPLLLLAVNLIWFQSVRPWESLRLAPLHLTRLWILRHLAPAAVEDPALLAADMTLGRALSIFVPTVVKGLTSAFALLTLGGLWGWRRVWRRRDHQPLFYVAVVILVAIWIHLTFARTSCPRYALPIALMASPFAALGLLGLTARAARLLERVPAGGRLRPAAAVPALVVASIGLGDALGNDYTMRVGEARLGQWLRQEMGPAPELIGAEGLTQVVAFYAHGECHAFPVESDDATIVRMIRETHPDAVVLLAWRWAQATSGRTLLERVEAEGFQKVDPSRLPRECRELLLVVREEKGPRVARRPVEASGPAVPPPPL